MATFIKITILLFFLFFNYNCQNKQCSVENPKPYFKMGQDSLIRFINQNMKNPYDAIDIEGTIYLSCIVETNGSISNIKIVRGVGGGWNEEATRLLSLTSGSWESACNNSKPNRDSIIIGIKCKIQ